MKPALAFFALGLSALILRGVISAVLPPALRPDLGLVVVVALGLHLPGAAGIVLAALLGYATDVLTGSLLGHHALVFVVAFALTRLAGAQLDLRRGLPVLFLVAALSASCGLLTVALARLFTGEAAWPALGRLLGQAGLDAVVAPLLLPLFAAVALRLSEDDRRAVHLGPRRREA